MSFSDSFCLRKLHGHCEDSAGSSAPLLFARSSFPPTVGRQACWLGWLLGWHSVDDLGRKEGRHTAIHGNIMHIGNRKALEDLLQLMSLLHQKKKRLKWAVALKSFLCTDPPRQCKVEEDNAFCRFNMCSIVK